LEVLNLGANPTLKILETIKVVSGIKMLKDLDLSENNISQVPNEIGNISNLYFLHLQGNKLTLLPETLSNLKKLRYVDMRLMVISSPDKLKFSKMLPNTFIVFDN
jgi:internalin A